MLIFFIKSLTFHCSYISEGKYFWNEKAEHFILKILEQDIKQMSNLFDLGKKYWKQCFVIKKV